MKQLDKLLLVNWHYIVHDILNLEQVSFLTGKNGSGKSTILDALQMLILGDTSGHFFNKAANDNSRRSLKGYLFGEVAEGEESGIVYLRSTQTFSSYVVAQFTDTVKKKQFCMGIVFDCESDGSHNHRFFSLLDELPAFHFIREGIPLGIQDLQQWGVGAGKGKFELFQTNKRYQDMFLSHMGSIGEKFFRLFRKAVPFSPIMDVAGFISEFVCDVEHRLDIEAMRENIRHYRRLEADLGYVRRKVTALTNITQQAQDVAVIEERLRVNQYLLDRAGMAELGMVLQRLDKEMASGASRLVELEASLGQADGRVSDLRAQRDAWREEQARSDVYATKQYIESRKQVLEAEFATLIQSVHRQERILQELTSRWSATVEGLKQAVRWFEDLAHSAKVGPLQPDMAALSSMEVGLGDARRGIDEAVRLIRKPIHLVGMGLAEFDVTRCEVNLASLTQARGALDEAVEQLQEVYRILQSVLFGWKDERRELEVVIAELKKGIKPYDAKVLTLQRAIAEELAKRTGQEIPVVIFAETLDIPDATWHKAIEGYLHTQRFYLLVPPGQYEAALTVYQSIKREKQIYDVGLVDVGRILEQNPERLPGSLADEVETDNPYARAYVDFLLGKVIKCDDFRELRKHRTAITADGMLYQSYVARQLDSKRWANLFIGKRALAQQLEQKTHRFDAVTAHIEMWTPRGQAASQWAKVMPPSEGDLQDVAQAQADLLRVPAMQQELGEMMAALASLDMSYLLELDAKIKTCEQQISEVEIQRVTLVQEQTTVVNHVRMLRTERRPEAERTLAEATQKAHDTYDDGFVQDQGEPRYQQELQRLKSPTTVLSNFGRQMQGDLTRKNGLWSELVSLRSDYNRDFQAGFDIQRPDNEAYATELQRLIESQLTEYEEKIRQAKERAQIQFQEDFVSKLQSNIYTVEGQIRDLNVALRGISFGRDQYRFQVSPNPQYVRFYEMIMDELLMEGFGLFSQTFQDKHGDVVEELFRNIVDVDEADGLIMTELEKNLEKFTDYRTYLNFDLIVKDEEGRESRLSRVIAKKSGGETQTPFYISVLASFVQLYRVGRVGSDNTLRLIVFDEAYSKMDHQRIRESVKLIRDLGLQVILSAPTEKLADIAPLVDKTLIVTRIQSQTKVLEFGVLEEAVNV